MQYLEIDIDNSIDVYAFMKSKMLNGIQRYLFIQWIILHLHQHYQLQLVVKM